MGYRGNVPDAGYDQADPLQGTDSRFPASAGALDENVDVTHPGLSGPPACLFRSTLRCEGRALAGALEAHLSGAGTGDHVALGGP